MSKLAEAGIDLVDGDWQKAVPACFHRGRQEDLRCAMFLQLVRQDLGRQRIELPKQPKAILAVHSLLRWDCRNRERAGGQRKGRKPGKQRRK